MRKNNAWGGVTYSKGFTLIELLAVIVILAIIALIATPIVLDIIEDSKNSSIRESANMYKSAAENAIATSAMNDGLEDGTYIIDNKGNLKYKDKEIKVDIKNYNFESGILVIEQGQIKDIKLIQNEKVTTGKELNKIDKWDGKTVKEVTEDSNGIYHITKASELAWVAQKVNSGETFAGKTISLDASLDLNNKEWTPIGAGKTNDTYNSFGGTFEGNNNVIKNLSINKSIEDSEENRNLGLFAVINSGIARNLIIINSKVVGFSSVSVFCAAIANSTINNIIVLNSTINSNKLSGIVIGYSTRSNLSNLYSYSSEITASDIYIGGVIGEIMYSSLDNAYSNSAIYNNGELRLSGTGGIVGGIIKESKANNLISRASIISNKVSGVGGITGQFQQASTLTNSVSFAKVFGVNYVGGVIGVNSGTYGVNILDNIKSYAEVQGSGEDIGGVIGYLSAGEHNFSNIYSKSSVKGKDKVGGIIGGFVENNATTLNYKNVISESTIDGETNVGDLWGYIDSNSIINEIN